MNPDDPLRIRWPDCYRRGLIQVREGGQLPYDPVKAIDPTKPKMGRPRTTRPKPDNDSDHKDVLAMFARLSR